MAQVIIVSNRLPVSVKKDRGKLIFSPTQGGVGTGLSSYVKQRRNSLWIGWPGIASNELTDSDKEQIVNRLAEQNYVPVFLSQKQIDNFYSGYSNSLIWPLFHDLKFARIKPETLKSWWQTYRSVNKLYSETVLHFLEGSDRVWVHDYQLMMLPHYLKENHKISSVGFFLHIPFPPAKQFAKLEDGKEILTSLLSANLVGLHTESYAQNLIDTVRSQNIGEIFGNKVSYKEHITKIDYFPMGIDYDKYDKAGSLKSVKKLVRYYKSKYRKLKVIISIDRLDPSKGLLERLKAYEELLKSKPELLNKVILVMVAAPSRLDVKEYKVLSDNLARLAKQINTNFGNQKWQPVDYINEGLPFENVTALFKIADVAFIAPKKDGMNLSAKEFVASNRKGVLVLSRTAGAAEELSDAILVNPSETDDQVRALNQALSMKRRELKGRLKRMRKYLSSHTVQSWAKSFVGSLNRPIPGTPHITKTLNRYLKRNLIKEYEISSKRLILLDYDGSLVSYQADFKKVKPGKPVIDVLKSLAKDKKNQVVIISGRQPKELEKWFSKININLVAEHGASIKFSGKSWKIIEKSDTRWKKLLLPVLEKYASLTPGAKVEDKPHSLVWHYRAASPYYSQKYAVILKRVLKPVLKRYGLQILQGNKVLEIKNPKVSKGEAVKHWLNFKNRYDFILAIGDDNTDEELFESLPLSAQTIKVGRGFSAAKYRLASSREVIQLLNRMA